MYGNAGSRERFLEWVAYHENIAGINRAYVVRQLLYRDLVETQSPYISWAPHAAVWDEIRGMPDGLMGFHSLVK